MLPVLRMILSTGIRIDPLSVILNKTLDNLPLQRYDLRHHRYPHVHEEPATARHILIVVNASQGQVMTQGKIHTVKFRIQITEQPYA